MTRSAAREIELSGALLVVEAAGFACTRAGWRFAGLARVAGVAEAGPAIAAADRLPALVAPCERARFERALVCLRAEARDELRRDVALRRAAVVPLWRVLARCVAVLVNPEPSEVVDGLLVVGAVAGTFLTVPFVAGRSVFALGDCVGVCVLAGACGACVVPSVVGAGEETGACAGASVVVTCFFSAPGASVLAA